MKKIFMIINICMILIGCTGSTTGVGRVVQPRSRAAVVRPTAVVKPRPLVRPVRPLPKVAVPAVPFSPRRAVPATPISVVPQVVRTPIHRSYRGVWSKKVRPLSPVAPVVGSVPLPVARRKPLSLIRPVRVDSFRSTDRVARQKSFLYKDFSHRRFKWHTLYLYNWPLFITTFPFAYYQVYNEYPPVYYDYYDLYGVYPERNARYDDLLSGSLDFYSQDLDECLTGCGNDCISECQASSGLSFDDCRDECEPLCIDECSSFGEGL